MIRFSLATAAFCALLAGSALAEPLIPGIVDFQTEGYRTPPTMECSGEKSSFKNFVGFSFGDASTVEKDGVVLGFMYRGAEELERHLYWRNDAKAPFEEMTVDAWLSVLAATLPVLAKEDMTAPTNCEVDF